MQHTIRIDDADLALLEGPLSNGGGAFTYSARTLFKAWRRLTLTMAPRDSGRDDFQQGGRQ
ncbi:hypothetical protein [Paraburkholderia sartisoli]|uniref:hypothetical protein n=1 Tax=Paraburkholderia sartisoli TaxID=83784 RepID=UPI001160584A|nr:hypothetical protein [Paraburkholderia sartisoli]